jgi:hypothetical protein
MFSFEFVKNEFLNLEISSFVPEKIEVSSRNVITLIFFNDSVLHHIKNSAA